MNDIYDEVEKVQFKRMSQFKGLSRFQFGLGKKIE